MNTVKFYKVGEPFGFLSNFAPYPIFIDKEFWKTVEHYFQASKFEGESLKQKIRKIDSPMEAAKEGRNRSNTIRSDWEDIKETIMLKALLCKFLQHPKLRKELVLTGDKLLVEHTKSDFFWADGGDGSGKNRLGELLMDVRYKVQEFSNDPDLILPPWIAFPEISQYDIFWRMGLGEDYLFQWSRFYLKNNKEFYSELFPAADGWEGIYD